jgi:hypothetical protein
MFESGRINSGDVICTLQTTGLSPPANYTGRATTALSAKLLLCGLVVRVPGYKSRGPGFDSWRYQIFWEVVGLEQDPLSLVRIIEELLESIGSGLENRN